MEPNSQPPHAARDKARTGFTLLVLLAVGGAFVVAEHWTHALPYLPWLLILACPLMHLFMHRGHGGHGGHRKGNPEIESQDHG